MSGDGFYLFISWQGLGGSVWRYFVVLSVMAFMASGAWMGWPLSMSKKGSVEQGHLSARY